MRVQPYIGELHSLGLAGSYTPVSGCEQLLEWAAVQCGPLGWAGGIIGATVAVRTVLLPVVLRSMRTNRTIMNLRPEAEVHSDRMKMFRDAGA